ncbi:MAG: hypothetical protein ABSA39_20705 [Edaphobacter sp.]
MRLVRLALILTMFCVAARAQQDTPRAFYTIRSSDSYRQAVLGVYQDYESRLSTHCPKIDINMNTSEAKVYGSIQTDADGNIVNAQWKEKTDGIACGEKRSYAAWVVIQDRKTQVLALFPGQSAAGPELQRDAVQYAGLGVGAGGSCQVDVLDTSLPNGEPKGPGAPWDERWTVRACGKKSVVTMHFVPDGQGMKISVNPKETVAGA